MYYPDLRIASPYAVIRRECILPDEATGGVLVNEGRRVDIRDVVARGRVPTGYVIIDAIDMLNLRKPEALPDLMLAQPGDFVQEEQVIAGKNPNRGRRIFAPVSGLIAQVVDGLIIMEEIPEQIDLEAGVRGKIASIYQNRGVMIEATGAHLQGTWGNGRRAIATIYMEPKGGVETAVSDMLEMRYAGAILVSRNPITQKGLQAMIDQNLNGIIGPSMDYGLREMALAAEGVIFLTEGFGEVRMNPNVYTMLSELDGQQVTIDAHIPDRWDARRPELVINTVAQDGQRAIRAERAPALKPGMPVRVTREPQTGRPGKIKSLPKAPISLENGLRVPGAVVEMLSGETVSVPLANLEIMGR